jgi:hypothetical protein
MNMIRPQILALLLFADCALGQTWTLTSAPTNDWSAIAASADGSKLIAAAGGAEFNRRLSPIYLSTNSGATWFQATAPSNFWSSLASSADGTNLFAAAGDAENQGLIYISRDAGETWNAASVPTLSWRSLASSADGSKIFALTVFDQMFRSTNSGLTWISNTPPDGAWAIACSADGNKVVAAPGNSIGRISTSIDAGATWTINNSPGALWWSVASSADGTKLIAACDYGIYTSSDSGATWVLNNVPPMSWQQVVSSADGTTLLAAAWVASGDPLGPLYTSTNSGLTWFSNNIPNQAWTGLASSADGSSLFGVSAVSNLTGVLGSAWASQTIPRPRLSIYKRDSTVQVSWTIPSTNFVLEQTSNLVSGWSGVTNIPVSNLTNLQQQVEIPFLPGKSFYRLRAH